MSSPTELYLPPTLPYPIKIVSLDTRAGGSVSRGTRLLSYSFPGKPSNPGGRLETRFGTWDSALDGELVAWRIKQGNVISLKRATETPAVTVLEPCKHSIQVGGLCAVCGKDMTVYANF